MGWTCGTYEWEQKHRQDFGRQSKERIRLARTRRKWEDNTKLDLKETGWMVLGGINQA